MGAIHTSLPISSVATPLYLSWLPRRTSVHNQAITNDGKKWWYRANKILDKKVFSHEGWLCERWEERNLGGSRRSKYIWT